MFRIFLKKLCFPTLILTLFLTLLPQLWAMHGEETCRCEECFEKKAVLARCTTQDDINNRVSATATRIYGLIHENGKWKYFNPEEPMMTCSSFWEPIWVDGKTVIGNEIVETKVATLRFKGKADDLINAFDDLINKPAKLECTIAQRVVLIYCLRDILGDAIFKAYANSVYSNTQDDSFFHCLGSQFLLSIYAAPVPGSLVYVSNIPSYIHAKPEGSGRGSNCVYTGEDAYLSFGQLYKTGPKRLADIVISHLVEFCNPKGVIPKMKKSHEAMALIYRMPKGGREIFTEEHQNAQKNYKYYRLLSKEAIEDFILNKKVKIEPQFLR